MDVSKLMFRDGLMAGERILVTGGGTGIGAAGRVLRGLWKIMFHMIRSILRPPSRCTGAWLRNSP